MIQPKLFRWDQISADSPIPLLSRKTVRGRQAMVAEISLKKGCIIKTHSHHNEQIAVVLSGRARFGLGEEGTPERTEVELTAGSVLVLDSWLPHSVEILEDAVIMDIFAPPADRMGVDDQKE